MEPAKTTNLEEQLVHLLRRVGQFAKDEFERFRFEDVKFKRAKDPFSYVDVTAEKMLKEGCSLLLPGSGFINEETEDQASENEYLWIIDPIDGTTNFTHGVPHFSISLALQKNEETIIGYIFEPVNDQLFYAQKGKGAYLNGTPIHVSERRLLEHALVAVGFPYMTLEWRDRYMKMVIDTMDSCHGMRRFGSAALDLAYVACGRLEAFFEYNLNPWDVAAGVLIVQEAGGMVTDFTGGDQYLYGNQIVASNGHVHSKLLEIIGNHLPA